MHIVTAWLLYQRSLSDDDWYSTAQRYLTQNACEKHIKIKCIHTRNFSKHTQKMCTKEAHESSSAIPIHVAHTVQSVVNVLYGVRKNGLTLSTLTPVWIPSILFSIRFLRCWQGDFVQQSLIGNHFLYSCDLNVAFRGDIVGEILTILVTLGSQRLISIWFSS